MKKNPTFLWLFIISLVASAVGYILTNSIKFGLCISEGILQEASCINNYERLGDPILYGTIALSIVFLILFFIPQATGAWKKFAKWFVPLAILLFIFYPNPGSGDYFSPYPEQVFQLASGLYVVISLLIIGKVALKHKKNSQTP